MRLWNYALSSADTAPETAPILLKGDIYGNIALAAGLGYQGLEVHTRENVEWEYGRINGLCEDHGVKIAAIVTGRLNTQGKASLIDDRPYVAAAAMEGMRKYIAMAQKLHTGIIIGWVKGNVPEGGHKSSYEQRLAAALRILCEEAGERSVPVYVEVINRYEVNLFNTAKDTKEFILVHQISNCYIHLDTFHMNIEENNPVEAIGLCRGILGYFHVADNTRLYPGSGTLDFSGYLSALKDIGYAGMISVECLPRPDGETAARLGLRHLLQCEESI